MADAWIPVFNRGRGRAPFNKGGRGLPRGGLNAVDHVTAHAATKKGSPILDRLLTSLHNTSTTDDTLALVLRVKQIYSAHNNIIVSP